MKTVLSRGAARPAHAPQRSVVFVLKVLPSALALATGQLTWADPPINPAAGSGLPRHGVVAAGAASGDVNGNQLTITQTSARAVLDWTSFDIDAGKSVVFNQLDAASAVLNRVSGSTHASQIMGRLQANGTVMLMNPNGLMFGAGSTVNVGSLIATTGTVHAADFMADGHARISGATGNITNRGSISATAGAAAMVALVAPSVINQKEITATGGTIALAGSTAATISLNNGLYEFAIPSGATGTEVSNTASASLQGATIRLGVGDAANLPTGVINLEGIQQASSAIVVNGDTVLLKSALTAPSVSGNAKQVAVYSGARIQDAVKIARAGAPGAGAAVKVHAGAYTEQVLLDKANMTLTGLEGAQLVVTEGRSGVDVTANGVTVEGMTITGPYSTNYTAINWDGLSTTGIAVGVNVTGARLRNNTISNVRTGIQVLDHAAVDITGNSFDNTKGSILLRSDHVTMSGNSRGAAGNEWDIVFLNRVSDGAYFVSPQVSQEQYGSGMMAMSRANGDMHVLDRRYGSNGLLGSTPQFGNRSHIVVSAGSNFTAADDFNLGNGLGNSRQPLGFIADGIQAVVWGGTVQVAAGHHNLTSTLTLNKSLTLAGAGEFATLIDARGVTGYGMRVSADSVSLSNFTFYGPSADVASSYGIKVAPGASGAGARLRDFSISQVSLQGAGRAELDLNGVDGALIDRLTADGAAVGGGAMTQGAGIQITDSANVTVRNSTTRNNAWGGLALYQANRYYNQQVSNITLEANNNFTERNPVYMQDESASQDFGALRIAGFGFAVRNTSRDAYTWLQSTPQNAFDFAVNLADAPGSYIQAWDGARTTQDFHVGTGNLTAGGTQALSIITALNQAASGANIRVGAGRYEDLVSNNRYNLYFSGAVLGSLKLGAGAAGSGIAGAVTADGPGGFSFDAPVRLLGDTTLTTTGADIRFNADIQSSNGLAYGLRLIAGSGGMRGNVHMVRGGTEALPIGQFEVVANRFSLADTLWVRGYRIDALGDVALSGHTLRAQDAGAANTLNAGGDVTGSTISLGSVAVVSAGDIVASISGTDVVAQAQGLVNVVVTASQSASFSGDSVVAEVTAPRVAVDAVIEARISGSSPSITIDAPKGSVTGSFAQVSNTGSGLVKVNGKPQSNQTVSANTENNRLMPGGSPLDNVGEGDGGVQLARADGVAGQAEGGTSQGTPETAGDLIDSGAAVELDLSPGPKRSREKKTNVPAKP